MRGRVAVLCLLVACGGQSSTTSTIPAPQQDPGANAPVTVTTMPPRSGSNKIRFGPSALRYMVHQQVRIEHDRPDMPPVTYLGWRTFVASTITGPADSLGYPAIFTVDSIVPDSGMTLPPWMDVAAARGLRFVGHLAPTGEFLGGRASDSASADKLSMLIGKFRNFYPRIPSGGVSEGDTWTDTLTLTDSVSGRASTRKAVRQVRAAGWEETASGRALRLEVTEQYEQAESGNTGQPFEAKGTGISSGVERIGAAGRYLGAVNKDSINLVITLPSQGLTIPRRQLTLTTVTVLP
jgi:hypothetical protein